MSGPDQLNADVQATWCQKTLMKIFPPTVRDMIGFTRNYEANTCT